MGNDETTFLWKKLEELTTSINEQGTTLALQQQQLATVQKAQDRQEAAYEKHQEEEMQYHEKIYGLIDNLRESMTGAIKEVGEKASKTAQAVQSMSDKAVGGWFVAVLMGTILVSVGAGIGWLLTHLGLQPPQK